MNPSPASIEAVQRSFDVVTPESDEFADLFYERLFRDHPGVIPLFEGVDLVRQRKKLFAMMTLVVSHLDRVEVVRPVLSELGRRHVGYGVTADLYQAFVETFLAVLAQSLGDGWSDGLARSWREALEQLTAVMVQAGADDRGARSEAESDELALLMQISGRPEISGAHTRLFTSFLAKKVHDHDLEIARDIQLRLLPEALHAPEGYAIAAFYEPAREVGGDYYDCFDTRDGRFCLAFGDVSGKGVAAALVMARLASAIQATVQVASDLGSAMASVNDHMCHRSWGGRFATLVGLLIDPVRHVAELANAGHRAPLVRRAAGGVEEFAPDVAGLPIGIVDGQAYAVGELALEPGDVILLFTDGIDESRSAAGELFGVDRIRKILGSGPPDPEGLGRALLEAVHAHSAGRPASDDIALLAVSRLR